MIKFLACLLHEYSQSTISKIYKFKAIAQQYCCCKNLMITILHQNYLQLTACTGLDQMITVKQKNN